MSYSDPMVGHLEEARVELRRVVCVAAALASSGIGLGLLFVAGVLEWPHRLNLPIILLIVAPAAMLPLLRKHPKLAFSAVTLVCGFLLVLLASWFPGTGASVLLVLPMVMTTMLIGPTWGLAATVLATYLALGGVGLFATNPPSSVSLALVLIWGVEALVLAMLHYVRDGMMWSWRTHQSNADLLKRARDQRLELKQTRADLLQANNELLRLSNRLDALLQVAQDARRAKEEFVANVSHELRTPLNMILGFSEIIMEAPRAYGERIPQALLADVGVILRNSQHLSSLINDVLALTRADASPRGLQRDWVRIADIIQEADLAIRPLFEAKGIYLTTEIADADLRVYCDHLRIRQVLFNLLSNAVRATDQGGVVISVRCTDTQVVVAVADTGPGIAPEDRERIFEPFRQAGDSSLRRDSSSGLGLTLSQRFIELHGGKIWLESEVGVGSVFSFSLPIRPPEELPARGPERWVNPHSQYEARDLPRKAWPLDLRSRYLVLESADTLTNLLARHQAGVEVLSVKSREEALAEAASALPRVLVVNRPPGSDETPDSFTDGLPYGLPLIGCWVPSAREAAEQLGVQDYLIKPIHSQDLLAAIERIGEARSVLLVDDSVDAVHLFTRMLRTSLPNLRILSSNSGKQGLTLLREHRPDLVLLDLVMPGMTGYAFLELKNRDPDLRAIPVIAISAQDPILTPLGDATITISRSGGLSLRDLFTCVQQVSQVLTPDAASADRGSAGGLLA